MLEKYDNRNRVYGIDEYISPQLYFCNTLWRRTPYVVHLNRIGCCEQETFMRDTPHILIPKPPTQIHITLGGVQTFSDCNNSFFITWTKINFFYYSFITKKLICVFLQNILNLWNLEFVHITICEWLPVKHDKKAKKSLSSKK